jgi:two-component system response regulator AtoC
MWCCSTWCSATSAASRCLRRIRQLSPETKVILISAHATLEQAVEAMKLGGYDFIRKPFELEEIVTTVRNAARTSELEGRVDYLARRAGSSTTAVDFCIPRR